MDWSALPTIVASVAAVVLLIDKFMTGRNSGWRDVAESKDARIVELEKRVDDLESQVNFLTSDFANVIATKVVEHLKENQ